MASLRNRIIFLDLETTGLASPPQDKIVEIAIVNYDGQVLLNTLIDPERQIGFTTNIHGITDEMVQGAPSFEERWDQIKSIITGKHVVIFNSSFDRKFFPDQLNCAGLISCAMTGFQQVYRAEGGTSRKYNLGFATDHIGYSWEGMHHRALADTFAARAVWLWMEEKIMEFNFSNKINDLEVIVPTEIPHCSTFSSDFHIINYKNHYEVELGDIVFLFTYPLNNSISLDAIEIPDNEGNKVSTGKLIGKKCGDIVHDFHYYGGLISVQIANIQRPEN